MGRYLDIARKLEEQKVDSPGSQVENREPVSIEPVKSGERLDFIGNLTVTKKFEVSQETAGKEAGVIEARDLQPLEIEQAVEDYKRFGYVKIFSAILDNEIYFAKNEDVAKRVPDRDIPVFLESDIEDLKGMSESEREQAINFRFKIAPMFGREIPSPDFEQIDKNRLRGLEHAI